MITMRKLIMKSDKDLNNDEKWQADVPYDTRQLAIKECITCYKSNETKLKKKQITSYNVNYKTKNKNLNVLIRILKTKRYTHYNMQTCIS